MENNTATNTTATVTSMFSKESADVDYEYKAWKMNQAAEAAQYAADTKAAEKSAAKQEDFDAIARAVYSHQQDRAVNALNAGVAAAAVVGGLAAVVAFNIAMLRSVYSKG